MEGGGVAMRVAERTEKIFGSLASLASLDLSVEGGRESGKAIFSALLGSVTHKVVGTFG